MALSANYKKNMHVGVFRGSPIALVLFTHYFQLMNINFKLILKLSNTIIASLPLVMDGNVFFKIPLKHTNCSISSCIVDEVVSKLIDPLIDRVSFCLFSLQWTSVN